MPGALAEWLRPVIQATQEAGAGDGGYREEGLSVEESLFPLAPPPSGSLASQAGGLQGPKLLDV